MNKGLKKAGTLFITASFMVQAFYSPFILLGYYLNTASYKKQCINKTISMLHCNGQCQMMKKLRQEQKKDEQNPERRNNDKNELLYLSTSQYSIQLFNSPDALTYAAINNPGTAEIATDFFQPPRV
jgi:hypothetical protein